jgi:hypothetical protein
MEIMTFKNWLALQETSPLTRKRSEVARGLQPPMADFDSHSTATPWERKQAKKAFDSTHKEDDDDDKGGKHSKHKGLTHHKPDGLISVGPDGKVNKKKGHKKKDEDWDV